MNDYHAAIYEAEEFMGGPATLPKGTTMSKTVTGTIEAIGRRQNTPDGNPRWVIDLNGKSYNTKDNTTCAHKVDPWDKGREVTLTLDGRRQIIGYELD